MTEVGSVPIPAAGGGALVARARQAYAAWDERRSALGLSNPGTVENIAREVQRDVFLSNSMFTGLRADITNSFSVIPMFQTSHAFSIGSQGLPPWTFLSIYGNPKVRGSGPAPGIRPTPLTEPAPAARRSSSRARWTTRASWRHEPTTDGAMAS